MPPQQTPPPETAPLPPAPGDTPPAETTPPEGKNSKKKLYGVLAVLVVLLIAAGSYLFILKKDAKDDTPQQPVQQSAQENQAGEQAAEPEQCAEGFTQFSGDTIGLHFCYPVTWGNAELQSHGEEADGHLAAGSHKQIVFSKNSDIVAFLMSKDWAHDDQMGHGGTDMGYATLSTAKDAAGGTNPRNILVDTDTQFALLSACFDFCLFPEKLMLSYTAAVPAHERYEVVSFVTAVDTISSEGQDQMEAWEEYQAKDLTTLFDTSDSRFTDLQYVAGSVRS